MLIVRAPRVGDDAAPVSGDTVESLRAEIAEARKALVESRAAHEADMRAHAECGSRIANAESLAFADRDLLRAERAEGLAAFVELSKKHDEVLAERDALRKQVTALEETATAPPAGKKK